MVFNEYSNYTIKQYAIVSEFIFNDVIFILILTLMNLWPEQLINRN